MTDTTKDAGRTRRATSDKPAQSACNGLLSVLLPYHAHDHSQRNKVHIRNAASDKALCGFEHHCYASTGATIIDIEWLNQADPDHNICKHCISIGRKLL